MTKEEAKKILDNMYGDWRTDEEREALAFAITLINAIEDIKAEIEALETYEYDDFIRMRAVLDIIDKHISGKEQE